MTQFTEMGGTYKQIGDYLIPNLALPPQETQPIGVCGQRHKLYLKSYHRVLYYNYLTSDKLNAYLADIDKQAEDMFSRLVKDLAENENVTKNLKAENQMLWLQRMNSIRNCATEVVNTDLIFV